MWAWIFSAMELSAKIALGSLFWAIAIGVVMAIAIGMAKAIDK